jgi:lipoic acid synthetase
MTTPAPQAPERATRSRANPGGGDVLKIIGSEVLPFRGRKPAWLKVPPPGGPHYRELTAMLREENLNTVCVEAACPNVGECWERGTATFMILGDTCTRRCGFCNVRTGTPTWNDPLEPARVARSIARMGLRHAVITSVDRDDLPDKGASAFVGVIRQVRRQAPQCKVEVLTPDFQGQEMPLARVLAERPDVFNHNVETVPRLYPVARRGSSFARSCRVLRNAAELGEGEVVTKSGLMVGLGESFQEMVDTFAVLREHEVKVLTVGQYLRPSERHLPVVRYWHPDEFLELERAANDLGFDHVAAGPLVRSSYHADQHVAQDQPGSGPLAASASGATTVGTRVGHA